MYKSAKSIKGNLTKVTHELIKECDVLFCVFCVWGCVGVCLCVYGYVFVCLFSFFNFPNLNLNFQGSKDIISENLAFLLKIWGEIGPSGIWIPDKSGIFCVYHFSKLTHAYQSQFEYPRKNTSV